MTILTVWSDGNSVLLAQLSDEPEDGTPAEQIAYMAGLEAYQGFTCVADDFTGAVPDADPVLWRWNGAAIISLPDPSPVPTIQQVGTLLQQLGMSQVQLAHLFEAAAEL